MEIKDKTTKELWNQFNNIESEDFLSHTIINVITELSRRSPENDELQKEVDLEKNINILSNWLGYFNPNISEINEEIDYFVKIRKTDSSYYKRRLSEANTSLLKWHYSLACYLLCKGDYILDVVELMLESAKTSGESAKLLNCVHYLVFAYNLNSIYGLKLENKINEIAIDLFYKLEFSPRYMLEPAEVVTRIGITNNEQLSRMINLLDTKCEETEKEHLKELFLRRAISLCNLDKRNLEKQKINLITKLAKIFENLGDKQTEGMIAVDYYERAQQEYRKLNEAKKVNALSDKIRNSYEKINWTENKFEMEIPKIDIPGNSGFERVKAISNFSQMIPDLEKLEQNIKKLNQEFPLQNLFKTTHFNKQQPTSHPKTDEENKKSQIKTEMIREISIMENILSVTVRSFEKNAQITSDDYLEYLKCFGLHDKHSLEIIKQGIERHFESDFISSIHILVPQIETTIRELLKKEGIYTTRIKKDIIQNILLETLITKGSNIFGNDLAEYLKLKFTDMDGLNQRNDVCHGTTSSEIFTHATSLSIIYVILMLTKLSIKTPI